MTISNEEYLKKLNVLPSYCDCVKCQNMCHAPCCASVEDVEKLMKAGYANRLSLDDWPGSEHIIKPALKGFEGKTFPWETETEEGCTFWREGKCELHNLDLKPIQGKIAYHERKYDIEYYGDLIDEDWGSERGLEVIKEWKKAVNYDN